LDFPVHQRLFAGRVSPQLQGEWGEGSLFNSVGQAESESFQKIREETCKLLRRSRIARGLSGCKLLHSAIFRIESVLGGIKKPEP
jgi:hypothetical protein